MKGQENLIPLNQRAKDVQRKIQSAGGKARAEKTRRRKSLRDSMNLLLEMPPVNKRDFNKLVRLGYLPEDLDNSLLVVVALFEAAKSGDVQAIKELRNLIGEDVQHDAEQEETLNRLIEAVNNVD